MREKINITVDTDLLRMDLIYLENLSNRMERNEKTGLYQLRGTITREERLAVTKSVAIMQDLIDPQE